MTTLTSSERKVVEVKTGRRGRRRTKRGIVPEDLLRFRYLSDPNVSPDGDRVVFVEKIVGDKNEYESNLWIAERGPRAWGEPRQFTGGGKDTHPRWSPDGGRIAFIGGRKKGHPQIFTIAVDGGEATALTDFPEGSIGTFRWSPDGRRLAASFRAADPDWTEEAKKSRQEKGLSDPPRVLEHYWYRFDGDGYFNRQRYKLYLLDAADGEARELYGKDTLGFFSFDFSPDSRQLAVTTNRDRRAGLKPWDDDVLLINVSSGKATPIRNLPAGPKDAVRWSPNGRWLAWAGREGPDGTYSTENLELWICDPAKGGARSLTGREDHCLMSAPMTDTAEVAFSPVFEWSPDSKRIYMHLGRHGELHLASVRPGGGGIVVHTQGAKTHALGNLSADGTTAAMMVGSPTRLDEVHVADLRSSRVAIQAVTDRNGELLKELELATPTARWVDTPDGTRVQTWVLRPRGSRQGRKHPAVLEIHGGPHAQYGVGFFHEFQVLAAAGYVVVYSNPRGSKGYGRDHCHSIRGAWGTTDWIDIQSVAEFMKDLPYVDERRMGVMGGSYGGYMTNWAIGHTNDFAAAITDRCVSNLVSLYNSGDFLEPPDIYWPGNTWDRTDVLWSQSPLSHFGSVRTPTLIIHSEGDLRCNVEQAEQVFSVLNLRNVPCRFVRYPRNSSHGMSRGGPPDLRVHRLQQILDWWKKYLRK